ncbi:acetylcholine receptor subunit beta, partial [Biomphalaria glabrata]
KSVSPAAQFLMFSSRITSGSNVGHCFMCSTWSSLVFSSPWSLFWDFTCQL